MRQALTLRKEMLTELSPDDLATVNGGTTMTTILTAALTAAVTRVVSTAIDTCAR